MSESIEISGLDKADVLAALFNNSRQQGMGKLHTQGAKQMTSEEARPYIQEGRLYFDYLLGRVMKVDISGDSFEPWLYDRDNRPGAALQAIDHLKAESV